MGLVAFLAVMWARSFGLPLGDSHEGRIIGQFALHVRNFWDLGPSASSFGAVWEPFSDVPYTHHPPLLTGLHLAVSTVFGQGLWQLKAVSYLAGLATVPAFFWVGRRMGFGPLSVAAATGALVATPFWFVYGRLGLGFLPNLLMVGMVLLVADEEADGATVRGLRRAAVASAAAVAASWQGVFLAPLLWLWLLRRRGLDRTVVVVGAGMAVGALVVLVWVTQGAGVAELSDHAGTRVGFDWTIREFLERQWMFARRLLPTWYLVLALPALVAGLADARSRFLTAILASMVVAFAVVPADNAWVHDYWNFPALMALFPGFAALAERVGGALSGLRLEMWRDPTDYIYGICNRAQGYYGGPLGLTYDIVPGNAADSVLPFRLGAQRHTDNAKDMMPPLGRSLADHDAVALVRQWIDAMPAKACATLD